jgi:hypothetical protein
VIEADVRMLIEIRDKTHAEEVLTHATKDRETRVILPVLPHFFSITEQFPGQRTGFRLSELHRSTNLLQ